MFLPEALGENFSGFESLHTFLGLGVFHLETLNLYHANLLSSHHFPFLTLTILLLSFRSFVNKMVLPTIPDAQLL
jgi:hypothetical protein